MPQHLNYGAESPLELQLQGDSLLADLSSGAAPPVDVAAAVADALQRPLDFPPLAAAAVPGDRVVIALERAVPQAAAVVSGIVGVLLESGVDPGDVTIVLAENGVDVEPDPRSLLPDDVREQIAVFSHQGNRSSELAYLAATRDGRPIYINRLLCDADVVIPVGSVRLETQPDYIGVHGSLFPGFSDSQTRQRFSLPAAAQWVTHRRQRSDEAAEAAWLLGVQFTVQVVPGGSDSLLHVLAGEASAVARAAQQVCHAAWQRTVPGRADLVVAAIDGGPQHQTWENVGRALYAASRVVSDEGDIVICCDLRRLPGVVLRKATAAYLPDFDHVYSSEGGHEYESDEYDGDDDDYAADAESPDHEAASEMDESLSACMLSELLERNRVYLLSGLNEDVVTDLGMAYVEQPADVARLASRHDSCILLASAQYAIPTLAGG